LGPGLELGLGIEIQICGVRAIGSDKTRQDKTRQGKKNSTTLTRQDKTTTRQRPAQDKTTTRPSQDKTARPPQGWTRRVRDHVRFRYSAESGRTTETRRKRHLCVHNVVVSTTSFYHGFYNV
jgi:hypothetical protein